MDEIYQKESFELKVRNKTISKSSTLWLLTFVVFMSMSGLGLIVPVLPLYVKEMGAKGIWIGFIISAFSIPRIISGPYFGKLADLKGKLKPFIASGLALFSFSGVGLAYFKSLFLLFLTRFFQGLGSSITVPISSAFAGKIAKKGDESFYMSILNTGFFLGFGFGPFIGGLIADYYGYFFTFITMAVISFLAFIIVLLFLPDIKTVDIKFKKDSSNIFQIIKEPFIQGLFALRTTLAFARGSIIAFFPIFVSNFGASKTEIGVLLTVQLILISVLLIPLGKITDKIKRKRMQAVLGHSFAMLCTFLIPFLKGVWVFLVPQIGIALGTSFAIPAILGLLVESGRKFGMASVMGLMDSAFAFGLIFGPIISGKVYDLIDIKFVFYICASIQALGLFWFAFNLLVRPLRLKPQ